MCGGLRSQGEEDATVPLATLLEEGERHYAARRYSPAIRSFEAALDQAKGEEREHVVRTLARVRGAFGMELLGSGELKEAARLFRLALDGADDAYALFGSAYLRFVRLDDAAARELLERALALEPKYARAHVLLALIEYRAGRTQAALAGIERALALDATDREASALRERWTHAVRYEAKLREERRGRFVVRSHRELPAASVKRVTSLFLRAHKELAASLATWRTTAIVVVLLPEDVFQEATGSRHFVGGTFDGQLKLPVPRGALGKADIETLDRSVRHELAHALVRQVLPECPGWLNEGLAQHFEGGGERALKALREKLVAGADQWLELAAVPPELWRIEDEGEVRWIYVLSFGFVEYLVGEFQEYRLRLLLDAIRDTGSVGRAFREVYGADLGELESRWRRTLTP